MFLFLFLLCSIFSQSVEALKAKDILYVGMPWTARQCSRDSANKNLNYPNPKALCEIGTMCKKTWKRKAIPLGSEMETCATRVAKHTQHQNIQTWCCVNCPGK